jgi:hypothetical protein
MPTGSLTLLELMMSTSLEDHSHIALTKSFGTFKDLEETSTLDGLKFKEASLHQTTTSINHQESLSDQLLLTTSTPFKSTKSHASPQPQLPLVEMESLNQENNVTVEYAALLNAHSNHQPLFADLLFLNVMLLKCALDHLLPAELTLTMDLKLNALD